MGLAERAGSRSELLERVCSAVAAGTGDVRQAVTAEVRRITPLTSESAQSALIESCLARLSGLGLIDSLFADPDIDEIMINAGSQVWVERSGLLEARGTVDRGAVEALLERALSPLGRRVDRTSPIVDARLPNGARLCAVVSPVAVDGTCVTVRRHRHHRFGLDSFATPEVADLIDGMIRQRSNILIVGATSSGKTSLLGAMLDRIDRSDRLVLLEDTAELPIKMVNGVRLEARPDTADAHIGVDLSDLVVAAMRLRPDRLVIGEFRGPEVKAVIEALNTGHDGSLCTCHANSAEDGLRRVETLLMQAAPSWPLAAIRRQVSRSIDAIIYVARDRGGTRSVRAVAEVIDAPEPTVRALAQDGVVLGDFTRGRRG